MLTISNYDRKVFIPTRNNVLLVLFSVCNAEKRILHVLESVIADLTKKSRCYSRDEFDVELIVNVNGTTDRTCEQLLTVMQRHRHNFRITMLYVHRGLGQTGSINMLYAQAKERYTAYRMLSAKFNDNGRLYLAFVDDDVIFLEHPDNPYLSNLGSNIDALEEKGLRAVSSTSIVPDLLYSYRSMFSSAIHLVRATLSGVGRRSIREFGKELADSVRTVWEDWCEKVTNVRKQIWNDASGRPIELAQIYGHSMTLRFEDFPDTGIPIFLPYADCYICVLHYPKVSINSASRLLHREPRMWRVFARRIWRDLNMGLLVRQRFKEDGVSLTTRFDAFCAARDERQAEVTAAISRLPALHPVRVLNWVNWQAKRFLRWRWRRGYIPIELKNPSQFVSGTNFRPLADTRHDWQTPPAEHEAETAHATRELLCGRSLLGTRIEPDAAKSFCDLARNLWGASDVEQAQITSILTDDKPRTGMHLLLRCRMLMDLSVRNRAGFWEKARRYELLKDQPTSAIELLQALQEDAEWHKKYVTRELLAEKIGELDQAGLQALVDVATKAGFLLDCKIIHSIFSRALEVGARLALAGHDLTFESQVSDTVYSGVTQGGTHVVLRQLPLEEFEILKTLESRYFVKPTAYCSSLQTMIADYFPGRGLGNFLEGAPSLLSLLDIVIQVGEATESMHEKGMVYGDIQHINAVVAPTGDYILITDAGLWDIPVELSFSGDAFGLASLLYYSLTWSLPHFGSPFQDIVFIPAELGHILQKALGVSLLQEQPSSISELISDLREMRALVASQRAQDYIESLGNVREVLPKIEVTCETAGCRVSLRDSLTGHQLDRILDLMAQTDPGTLRAQVLLEILQTHLSSLEFKADIESCAAAIAYKAIRPPRTLVRMIMAKAAELGAMLRIGKDSYAVLAQLHPVCFLASSRDGHRVVLKLADPLEYSLLKRAQGPGVVVLYGFDESMGILVTEYLELGWSDVHHHDPSPFEVVNITIALADTLASNNEKNVVHRDCNTANVRFDCSGAAKLIDYGLARPLNSAIAQQDVFAVGAFLLNLITGARWSHFYEQAPGATREVIAVQNSLHYEDVPYIPPEANRVIRKALLKDPTGVRYRSVRELLSDLRKVNLVMREALEG